MLHFLRSLLERFFMLYLCSIYALLTLSNLLYALTSIYSLHSPPLGPTSKERSALINKPSQNQSNKHKEQQKPKGPIPESLSLRLPRTRSKGTGRALKFCSLFGKCIKFFATVRHRLDVLGHFGGYSIGLCLCFLHSGSVAISRG